MTAVDGVELSRPLAVASRDHPDERIIADLTSAQGPSLLPADVLTVLGRVPPRDDAVHLTGFDAYRYRRSRSTIYVAPTSAGVLTIVCQAPAATCDATARTLRPSRGQPYPLGRDAGYQAALQPLTAQLRATHLSARRELHAARTRTRQARAADRLAAAFAHTATALREVPPSPADADVHGKLVAAVSSLAGGYEHLAAAARANAGAKYARAVRAVRSAEDRYAAALQKLGARGY